MADTANTQNNTAPSSNTTATVSVFNSVPSTTFPQPGTTVNGSGKLKIVDHGDWSSMTKDAIHDDSAISAPLVPAGTMFCHRNSDNKDWYVYSRAVPSVFAYGSVLMTCLKTDKGLKVQSVFFDPQRIFPANSRLIELQNYNGPVDDIHKLFEDKWYNEHDMTITDFMITLDDLKDYASQIKDIIESGGITVNGMAVATDRASQAMITQTVVGLQLLPNVTINWKNPDNTSTVLSADFIRVMATFVLMHVSNTFNLYPQVIKKIEDGELGSYNDILKYYTDNIPTAYVYHPPQSSNTTANTTTTSA